MEVSKEMLRLKTFLVSLCIKMESSKICIMRLQLGNITIENFSCIIMYQFENTKIQIHSFSSWKYYN